MINRPLQPNSRRRRGPAPSLLAARHERSFVQNRSAAAAVALASAVAVAGGDVVRGCFVISVQVQQNQKADFSTYLMALNATALGGFLYVQLLCVICTRYK